MYTRRVIAALGLAAAALTTGTTMPASADEPQPAAAVTMDEQDCRETNVGRAVLTSGLDPLVPDRYTLLRISPTASRVIVTTYTCAEVSMDAQPVVGHTKPTTVTIGTATVTHRDGQQLPTEQQQYILWYGTDNPVQFAKLQQTGLPVSFLPASSVTATSDAGTTTIDWVIRGAGLDYTEQAVAVDPVTNPSTRTTTWWHDGPKGDLSITYDNLLANSTAMLTADFTGNELLSEIIALPTLLKISGVTFTFVSGSWTSQVAYLE
jgi:hypothetical protein